LYQVVRIKLQVCIFVVAFANKLKP